MDAVEPEATRLAKYPVSLANDTNDRDSRANDYVLQNCPLDSVHKIRLVHPKIHQNKASKTRERSGVYLCRSISPTTKLAKGQNDIVSDVLDISGEMMGQTGKGSFLLSFRWMAFSALCPVAVAATYSIRRRLFKRPLYQLSTVWGV